MKKAEADEQVLLESKLFCVLSNSCGRVVRRQGWVNPLPFCMFSVTNFGQKMCSDGMEIRSASLPSVTTLSRKEGGRWERERVHEQIHNFGEEDMGREK